MKKIKNFLSIEKVSRTFFSSRVLKISRVYFIEIINHPIPWETLSIKGKEPYKNMYNFINDKVEVKNLIVKFKTEQIRENSGKLPIEMIPVIRQNELVQSPCLTNEEINELLNENRTSEDNLIHDTSEKSIQIEPIPSNEIENNLTQTEPIKYEPFEKNTKKTVQIEENSVIVIDDSENSNDSNSVIEIDSISCYENESDESDECINIKFEIE